MRLQLGVHVEGTAIASQKGHVGDKNARWERVLELEILVTAASADPPASGDLGT